MVTLTNPRADPPRHRACWQGGVVCEIYPRSLADADGDGVGDLRAGAVVRSVGGPRGVTPLEHRPFYG